MENGKSKIEDLVDHTKDYLNTSAELVELKTTQKMASVLSASISSLVIGLFFFVFFMFASIAFAYYLGTVTGKTYVGFLIVAGVYLLVGLFLWAGKEKMLTTPLLNMIVKQVFRDRNEEEN